MRCLKCKKEIPDNVLRCSFCHTKVQSVCPVCGSLNPLNSEFCSRCGLQLLKYCAKCGCVNFPNAAKCRKCGNIFGKDDEVISITDLEETIVSESVDNKGDFINEPVIENQQNNDDEHQSLAEPTIDASIQIESVSTKNSQEDISSSAEQSDSESESFDFVEVQDDELLNFSDGENIDDIDLLAIADSGSDLIDEEFKKSDTDVKYFTNDDVILTNKEENQTENLENLSDSNDEQVSFEDSNTSQTSENLSDQNLQEKTLAEDEISDKISTVDKDTVESDVIGESRSYNQLKSKNLIVKAVQNPQKLIIGLSAPEGYGKSTVLRYLFADLKHRNCAWLWGECSANSQISPYGIFQEMILTFFNMPNFSNMSSDFLKQAKTMLSETLPFFSQDEIFNLFNFLYPSLTSNFEDILINKDITFALLEKFILELSKKTKLILVIDDFDMIDGASYAFLTYFIEQGHLCENIKLIISYKDDRVTQGYFYSEKLNQNQYEDIRLAKLTKDDSDNLIKLFFGGKNPLPPDLFDKIYEHSDGNSAYIEQIMVLLNENNAFQKIDNDIVYQNVPVEENLPKNLHEILSVRLSYIQNKYPMCFRTLCTAAIMGNKFNVKLLGIVMKLKEEEFQYVMQLLTNFAYVAQFNNNIYEFKNTILWKFIYEKAKQNKDFILLNEKIFDIISSFTLSSNALKALIAQNLNQKLLALNIWTENIKLCAYLGDEHLWTLSQKQCLKIAEEVNSENNEVIINNIHERLGKLLYVSRPAEAVPYLSAAINNALKIGNRPKIIELSGYLSKSCSLVGNYFGVIEAVDTVLKVIDSPNSKLEMALIKHKKMKAMFSVGNAEEIFNLASNEIVPVVEQALSGVISNNGISMDVIYETWLECNLTVAMALISQGNNKCFDILKVIDEIVAKNNVTNKNYLQRLKLAKALAYCVQGQVKHSEDILISLSQETSNEIVAPEIISLWNFTNILNKLFKREWANLKEDMYSVVTFANNYNDVLVKNLLKVFLGKILQEEGNLSKALDIFNEQVTVFAKAKIAIGALLCWYYIAKLTLVSESSDKALDIAQKALDVAKNPKISNYYFIVQYKKLIAEIYLIKGDTEAAKMYIEKALMIVKKYDMKLLKVSLYQLYAKYLEEMVSKKPQNKANYASNAINTYQKALGLVSELDIPSIEDEIQKNYSSFKAFCQLNNIKV